MKYCKIYNIAFILQIYIRIFKKQFSMFFIFSILLLYLLLQQIIIFLQNEIYTLYNSLYNVNWKILQNKLEIFKIYLISKILI